MRRQAEFDLHVLDRAAARATAYTLATEHEDGSWHTDPDPRIIETALSAIALTPSDRLDARPAVQRATAWLRDAVPQQHHPVAEIMERVLRSTALAEPDPIDFQYPWSDDTTLSSRVRLLQVVLLHAGRAPLDGDSLPRLRRSLAAEWAAQDRLKSWSRIELWSAHALVESHFGNREQAERVARRIAAEQSPQGDFFANPVSTALAALALHRAAPDSAAAQRALSSLIGSQRPDGTWRFCTSDVWDTTVTVRAFRGDPDFDRHALARATDFLVTTQNADGGWPFRSGVESDIDTTSAALISLAGTSAPDSTIRGGLEHLAAHQLPNGLWRTWQSAGDPAVEDVVAHAVVALGHYPGMHSTATDEACSWLAERFERNGRWWAGWYRGLPYATAEIAAAFAPGDPTRQAAAKALAATQNADGGWPAEPGETSRPSATGSALAALERTDVLGDRQWEAGLEYLITTQRDDGTWPGQPDMLGPRPLATHYQTHTHALATMGLRAGRRHLWSRSGFQSGSGSRSRAGS